MKVYLVYMKDYDEVTIHGIFSSRELAEECVPHYRYIEEMIIDENVENLKKGLIPMDVYENRWASLDENGKRPVEQLGSATVYKTYDVLEEHMCEHFGKWYAGHMWASSIEEAISKFKQLRSESNITVDNTKR